MRRELWRTVGAVLLLGSSVVGCHRSAVQQKQPPDPLLMSKLPVKGKPTSLPLEQSARLGPLPPPTPDGDYATAAPPGEPPSGVRSVLLQTPVPMNSRR
jgi:hypothetical protein